MWTRGIGPRTRRAFLVTIALLAIGAVSGQAFAGTGPVGAGVAAATTTTTLPPIPKVSPSITDGQSPQALLANAIELSSVGIDTSALATAIAATQAKMDSEAAEAHEAATAAARAAAAANEALRTAASATQAFESTDSAVKVAVTYLYTRGPMALSVNPGAGVASIYAADYAESAISPFGILSTRFQDERDLTQALGQAKSAQAKADKAEKKSAAALAAERSEVGRLQSELSAISKASAVEVEADHVELAAQAGQELLAASSLQFNPKTPVAPPLSTTPVALTWAFAELGKPYVWGATGPSSFDCSGLTQFVWRAAGVSIPRVAADQDAWTIPVPLSQLLPGDLVFYGETDIHHVGIYIGDGLMINAPHTGTMVQVSSIWWSDLAGFGRVHAQGIPVPPHQPPSLTKPAQPVVVPTPGPVPSQTKPPKGWTPHPGSSTPIVVGVTTTTTTSTTTVDTTTTTTVEPGSTTTTAGTSTTLAGGP
jgi:peptidoglycan DL-endopeptidase CwlO